MPITWDFSKSSIYLEGKAAGKAEAIAEGKAEVIREMAVTMLKAGKYPIEEISDLFGLTKEEVIEISNTLL